MQIVWKIKDSVQANSLTQSIQTEGGSEAQTQDKLLCNFI